MSVPIGIDLGTTNSCAYFYKDNHVNIIYLDGNDQRTLPSCVLFDNDLSEVEVGRNAEKRLVLGKHPVIFDSKRMLGRKFDDPIITLNKPHWPFSVTPGPNNDCQIEVKHKTSLSTLSPEEVSAEILKKIKLEAEKQLQGEVNDAVITVPAYFTDAQRRATINAANLAQLNVLELINEPTAAALAFAYDKKHTDKLVLVYDLGGGTFDVSLVRFTNGEGKVVATNGHSNLGGRDFDNNLANYVIKEKHKEVLLQSVVEKDQRRISRRLKDKCKEIKEILSEKTSEDFDLDDFANEDIDFLLTREVFEEINAELFKKTIEIVDKTLREAKIEQDKIDDILLIGGSTRIPKIRELLSEYFNGRELSKGINPDEAVAMGAALKAAVLNGTYGEKIELISLRDITTYSLGIEIVTKEFSIVIPKNTEFPTTISKPYYTANDFQTEISIIIFQGEEKLAADNIKLGEFVVDGVKPLPKGKVKVDVEFSIDSNNILKVTATESSNQKTNSVQCNLKHF